MRISSVNRIGFGRIVGSLPNEYKTKCSKERKKAKTIGRRAGGPPGWILRCYSYFWTLNGSKRWILFVNSSFWAFIGLKRWILYFNSSLLPVPDQKRWINSRYPSFLVHWFLNNFDSAKTKEAMPKLDLVCLVWAWPHAFTILFIWLRRQSIRLLDPDWL